MSARNDIDIAGLIADVVSGKWLIVTSTGIGIVAAAVVAFAQPDVYRAEALLAPNHEQAGSRLAGLEAQYGGLATLAGIDVAGQAADKTELGLSILQSRRFVSEFIQRHDILVELMAARSWDRLTRKLRIDDDDYDVASSQWVHDPRPPRQKVPSMQEAYEAFMDDVLQVSHDKATGFVVISVSHVSPDVAKQWVDWLVADLNRTVMQQDVSQAEQAIAYLEEQIAATPLAELQNVFFRLIEEQTKTVLLAKVSPEYLFRTIDPAVAPEMKAAPRRTLILIIGLILGAGIGIIIVLARSRPGPGA